MIEAQPYPQEERRLASLRRLNLLDMPIEERFERITRMVCHFLDVPIAIFNLLDHNRQHYKSVQGIDAIDAPLPAAFCTHVLHEQQIMLVPDARRDDRFSDNPHVLSGLSVRFYAGCPVRTPDGMPVGTLCAIDTKPRHMTEDQITLLQDLTAFIETELRANNDMPMARGEFMREENPGKRASLVDPLTRLWKRDAILTLLTREGAEAIRRNEHMTVIVGGIDNFEKLKDVFGAQAGDTALKEMAKKILHGLRRSDDAGRYGPSEFLIVLPGGDNAMAIDIAERLRKSVSHNPVEIGAQVHGNARVVQSYPVTMSFGTATLKPGGRIEAASLVRRAEENLAKARKDGGNKVVTT